MPLGGAGGGYQGDLCILGVTTLTYRKDPPFLSLDPFLSETRESCNCLGKYLLILSGLGQLMLEKY